MKILLAYDGFDHSQPALEEAGRIAAAEGAGVTAFSVVPPDARGSKAGGHVGIQPHADEDVARAPPFLPGGPAPARSLGGGGSTGRGRPGTATPPRRSSRRHGPAATTSS